MYIFFGWKRHVGVKRDDNEIILFRGVIFLNTLLVFNAKHFKNKLLKLRSVLLNYKL